MKNSLKYLILIIFLSSFLTESSAKILQEETKFQLQFNKSLFVSGEKIWFKNSILPGFKNDHQNILFVDLCDEETIITSRILVRENNHWQGEIAIPDSLETGIYLFRAYIGNYDGKPEIVSKLVTVINRFGNNQTNKKRRVIPGYKPLDLISQIPADEGNILKTYTKSSVYKTKNVVECWIEKEKADLPAGISFSVYKIPDNLFFDSLSFNPQKAERLVEYTNENNAQIFNRLTLSGKVIYKINKMPVSGEKVLLSIPDSIPQINYATTNDNGEFRFFMDDYYGQQDIIIQTLTKDEKYEIILFSNLLVPPSKIPFYIPDYVENSEFIKLAVERALLQKAYNLDAMPLKTKLLDKYPFYGKSSNIVIPGRFIDLDDFEEITKELLPLCNIRKGKDKVLLRIFDQTNYNYFDTPMILVDGVPIFEVKKLFPLNSPKIKRIEIQPELRCYGDLLLEGTMSIITSNGNFEDVTLPFNAVRTTYEAFFQPSEYTGNRFVNEQNSADFRDVLYWQPIMDQFSNVFKTNIQCSYEKGSYIAFAQTVDQDGVVHRSLCRFKVE